MRVAADARPGRQCWTPQTTVEWDQHSLGKRTSDGTLPFRRPDTIQRVQRLAEVAAREEAEAVAIVGVDDHAVAVTRRRYPRARASVMTRLTAAAAALLRRRGLVDRLAGQGR